MTDLMQRADWTDFRSIDGLVRRGGIAVDMLRLLIAKELLDNAMDALDEVGSDAVPTVEDAAGRIVVDDLGPGIRGDPEEVARLFAFGRDRLSSKYARKPTRGMLGNGLRLVSGAVFASGGRLDVWTNNRHLRLTPQQDGTTSVAWEPAERPTGTRVQVWLNPEEIPPSYESMEDWLKPALLMFGGDRYTGRSSPHWFDGAAFFEYLQASQGLTVRAAVGKLARCTGAAAGELTRWWKGDATDLSPQEAADLLIHLQVSVDPVAPALLKAVGRREQTIGSHGLTCYARETVTITPAARPPQATIPVAIEAWGGLAKTSHLVLCVNRSPSTAPLHLRTYPAEHGAYVAGCGIEEWIETKRRDPALVLLNVTAPHLPQTSDGKAPDLQLLRDPLNGILTRTLNAVERQWPSPKTANNGRVLTGRSPVLGTKTYDQAVREQVWPNTKENAPGPSIVEVSGGGSRRYTQRQLFYNVRTALLHANECEGELKFGTFTKIIDNIEGEEELGHDLPGMARDPRGLVYLPHSGVMVPLGTLGVEAFRRPEWLFSNVLYIEKEGFFSILQEDGWPERHDCALMSAKGQSTRAAKDFIDMLADTGEPVQVFCLHDADAAGTMIYQALQEETKARPRRKVEIVNLGLEPWEARDMGLLAEPVEEIKARRPVAKYVKDRDEDRGEDWEEWLQSNRYELDSIPPDQFVPTLDDKMVKHKATKAIPDDKTLATKTEEQISAALRDRLRDDLKKRHRLDRTLGRIEYQLDRAMTAAAPMLTKAIEARRDTVADDIRDGFKENPEGRWVNEIEEIAGDLAERFHWVPPGGKR